MTGAERIADVARRHTDDLRGALAAFTDTQGSAALSAARVDDVEPTANHALRERLRAAADYTDLPPQILLPAQYAHDSPHHRGGRIG